LIAKLEEVLGRTLPIDFLPTRVGDVPASQADASKLGELFPGLEPAPLLEGLQATVDWFKSARPWER